VAFLKGLLDAILDERVTDVNAPLIARARGLRITETSTSESPNFTSSLGAALVRERGESSAEGVVFHRREPRLVRIDGFSIEAPLQGVMLVFSNLDVPGVIGRIGTLCGQNGLNIAGMQLGREHRGGRAISVVNLDDPVPEPVLAQIRAMPDIVFAKLVRV
jgi:D-3-phosphoglycerate dehydrogenase